MSVNRLVGATGYTPTVATGFNVPNPAGSGSSPVTVSMSFVDQFGVGQLPQNGAYSVHISPSQACFVSITNKTATGFNVVLTPLSTGTIAAGNFDVLVHS
jgi:hypothetical protein